MTLHLHHLTGCSPTPLAFYLKGLGVLRLVGEQKDDEARGWWQDEHFCLLTRLDRAQLEVFLAHDYAPTPFVSPWNKGSGFYNKADEALRAIERSTAARFARFRAGIAAGRAQLDRLRKADEAVRAIKDRTKKKRGMTAADVRAARLLKADLTFRKDLAAAERRFKELKATLFVPCLRSWRGAHREWMDAALVWLEQGRVVWPALLGTGGNDGNLDFTNNAMQRLLELFDLEAGDGRARESTIASLRQALWASASDSMVEGAAIGQFFPGGAGGANSSNGPGGDSFINPWDFILMLEGSIFFASSATRRLDSRATSEASAPFALRNHAVGHGTRGRENAERGEQWMPLWTQPVSVPGLRSLLHEARLQLGRRMASRPIDAARSVSRLGVDRGVQEFLRFGYLERNGQAKIAVPLGRIAVRARARSRLIDDLAPWLDRLRRLSQKEAAPVRMALAEGALADAVFHSLTRQDAPAHWQAILAAAVAVEGIQATGSGFEAGPIPPLDPDWLVAGDDSSPEWRLARALGSAAGSYTREGQPRDPVRHHWLPLDAATRRFEKDERRLRRDPRVVVAGRDPVGDLGSLVVRRLIEAAQGGDRALHIVSARGCGAHPADLARVVAGEVDLGRVSVLARALMAVRWERWRAPRAENVPSGAWPDEAWMTLRLAHLPWPLADGRSVKTDSSIVRRLLAGDGAAAVQVALRRVREAGLASPLNGACTDPETARLWAAALAFPIDPACAEAMVNYFEPLNMKETP